MLLSNLLKVNTSSYLMGSIVILNVCTDNRTDSDEFSLCGFRNVKRFHIDWVMEKRNSGLTSDKCIYLTSSTSYSVIHYSYT